MTLAMRRLLGRSGVLIVCTLAATLLAARTSPAGTVTTYVFDQSNALSNGVNYGTVQVTTEIFTADTNSYSVEFLLTANQEPYNSGSYANFGFQTFSFNMIDPDDSAQLVGKIATYNATTNASLDWSVSFDKNAGGGFGNFTVKDSGNGNSRGTPIKVVVSGLTEDQAKLSNFLTLSSGDVYFAAHIAGFPKTDNETSHHVGAVNLLVPAPEPSTLALGGLALGFLGLAGLRRRRAG